jgi:hypothetical protein
VLQYIQGRRAEGPFTVIDVGGSMDAWTKTVATAYADMQRPPEVPTHVAFFEVDLNMPCTWRPALEHVARHGKFDFSICSHTLEDLSCPKCAVQFLQGVSKAGYVALPSKYRECSRRGDSKFRGFIHHRWVFDVKGGRLVAYPKIPLLEYLPEADALAKMLDIYANKELSFKWQGGLPYAEVNGGFLGPTVQAVFDYYKELLD